MIWCVFNCVIYFTKWLFDINCETLKWMERLYQWKEISVQSFWCVSRTKRHTEFWLEIWKKGSHTKLDQNTDGSLSLILAPNQKKNHSQYKHSLLKTQPLSWIYVTSVAELPDEELGSVTTNLIPSGNIVKCSEW